MNSSNYEVKIEEKAKQIVLTLALIVWMNHLQLYTILYQLKTIYINVAVTQTSILVIYVISTKVSKHYVS